MNQIPHCNAPAATTSSVTPNEETAIGALHRCQRATSLTEFAIVLPVFLVMLSGLLSFQDLLTRLTLVEVSAYQSTVNEAMKGYHTDLDEAMDDTEDPDLSQHLGHDLGIHVTRDDLEDDAYPPIRPSATIDFSSTFDAQMTRHSNHVGQAVRNVNWIDNQYPTPPTEIRPLFQANAISGDDDALQELMGTYSPPLRASWTSVSPSFYNLPKGDSYRRVTVEGPGFLEGDGYYGELMEELDGLLNNQSSIFAAGLGQRYGVVAGHTVHETEKEEGAYRFSYEASYASYYTAPVPHLPTDATEAYQRATAHSRTFLQSTENAPYPQYLAISKIGISTELTDELVAGGGAGMDFTMQEDWELDLNDNLFDGPLNP